MIIDPDSLLQVDENGNQCLSAAMCCCVCLANCLAKIAETFTSYAFIIVGIYGYGFGKVGVAWDRVRVKVGVRARVRAKVRVGKVRVGRYISNSSKRGNIRDIKN